MTNATVMPAVSSATSLESVAARYYTQLNSFFRRRVRNHADAEDLVQQVFLRLSQRTCHVQNVEAYILRAASNAWTDYWRHGVVQDRYIASDAMTDEQLEACGSTFSSERVLIGQEAAAIVSAALHQLPPRTREIFILRRIEGKKHSEVARLTGLSSRAVQKHFAKALVHLNKALD